MTTAERDAAFKDSVVGDLGELPDNVRDRFIGGTAVVVGLPAADATIQISPFHLLYEKKLTGSIYWLGRPSRRVPVMGELYRQGRLDLDILQGAHHSLDEVNEAFTELTEHRSPRPIVLPNQNSASAGTTPPTCSPPPGHNDGNQSKRSEPSSPKNSPAGKRPRSAHD
jgi:Zn-dependent alcohol dehydrogenase